MNKGAIVGGLVGLAAGALVGYIYGSRKNEENLVEFKEYLKRQMFDKYGIDVDEEHRKEVEAYVASKQGEKANKEEPEKVLEVGVEDETISSIRNSYGTPTFKNYNDILKKEYMVKDNKEVTSEPVEMEIEDKDYDPDEENYEKEEYESVSKDVSVDIETITLQQYINDKFGYGKECYVYHRATGDITDEDETEVIEDSFRLVGDISQRAIYADNGDSVYIRNNKLSTDFEIIIEE